MTISLITTPTYALPGAIPVVVSGNGAGTNFVRLWCTDAPLGSKLRKQLDATGATRIEVLAINSGDTKQLELEIGGKYVFAGQEYTLGAATYGGGYARDPNAYKSETKVGAEQTGLAIYVGERLTQRLGSGAYGTASLLLHVWNDTVRPTTLVTHNVLSPAIIDPSNPRAASAASASDVRTQLALFSNAAVGSLTTNLEALIAEMIVVIPKHFNNSGGTTSHSAVDSANDTEIEDLGNVAHTAIYRARTAPSLQKAAQIISNRLRLHLSNSEEATRYHAVLDVLNIFIADPPSDVSSSLAMLADIYRVYEAHRVDATVHNSSGAGTPDNVNLLTTTVDPLLKIHKEFLEELALLSMTASGATQTATVTLSSYGFRRER